MTLAGIELYNFRSIGDHPVVLTPWRKCNVLIGQNNAGKSNVIRATQKISNVCRAGAWRKANVAKLEDLDLHRRSQENRFQFRLHFEFDDPKEELARLARTGSVYFDFVWQQEQAPTVTDHTFAHIEDFFQANDLLEHFARQSWTNRVGPDAIRQNMLELGNQIFSQFSSSVPPVHIIPEFRQIRPGNEYTLAGTNLIELLASYQHPEIGKDQDQDKFERIQKFVRQLLHLPEAILEVSNTDPTIILNNDNLRLPLASYGTGVHELVILITAVLSIENSICCIEEPEIHLHPRLQRELVSFIVTETTNQYLISTHSPTFINTIHTSDQVQVFHLRLENGATVGDPILRDEEGLLALHDLGVKASDILQSNCVVWVEGPSDRIYLNRWLELVDSSLVEGRDYSIMFYGGRLLSHLHLNREQVPDLIRVLRINQNSVVVIDSDRKKAGAHLNQTKRRVQEECERSGSVCWVTYGREIENYLSERVVVAACEQLVGKQIEISIARYDKFEQVLSEALKAGRVKNLNYAADKVKYARKFAQHFELDDMTDQLKKRIEGIVANIRTWNK